MTSKKTTKYKYIEENFCLKTTIALSKITGLPIDMVEKVIEDVKLQYKYRNKNIEQMNRLTSEQRSYLIPYLTHPKYRNN